MPGESAYRLKTSAPGAMSENIIGVRTKSDRTIDVSTASGKMNGLRT